MSVDRTVTTVIDSALCIGCGSCVAVCPSDTLEIKNKKAIVSGDESLNCGHCAAACPVNAVSVGAISEASTRFTTFKKTDPWSAHGEYDTKSLINLMMSRRSCRNFKEMPVSREILEDLVKVGTTAPSGSNCQMWTFTLLENKPDVVMFGKKIAAFFKRLNRTAEKQWLRVLMKWLGKPELNFYFENYYEGIKEGLAEWEQGGKDLLFHHAPAVIVVASKNDASCPAEDALLATQNILLGAHSMGLGTCLIGFAVNAMHRDKTICDALGLPRNETPYSVIALGYPDETYQCVTGRKPFTIRYSSPE